MFGILFFERDPLALKDIPGLLIGWVQTVGGYAAFLAILYLIVSAASRGAAGKGEKAAPVGPRSFRLFLGITLLTYTAALLLWRFGARFFGGRQGPPAWQADAIDICLAVGGASAFIAVMIPFVANLFRLRPRRIWALSRLSFKEGVRRRILYVFSFLLLVLLFASWFIPYKPEDQVRTYVQVVDLAMAPLLLATAALVAAFSIPTDIRNQTIHTVLTKPVERFEVVLGRFFGFTGLMTLVLVAMTGVSLIYVLRGVDPEAAAASLKARDPLYGELSFENTSDSSRGESVGREWEYRSYISGPMPGQKTPSAVWSFSGLPGYLAERDQVRCEFSFDIYRTTKGYENRGVSCAFVFLTWKYQRGNEEVYRRRRNEELQRPGGRTEREIESQLAEELGYYEIPGMTVVDYRTLHIDVPGGLFRGAIPGPSGTAEGGGAEVPQLQVKVTCNSSTQYVGMARYDLYLRLDRIEGGNDRLWFAWNFLKGSAGLWFRLCLVIGLAVALSTYLTGVISLLLALLLYVGGYSREFIEKVASGTNIGGGPLESLYRLATRTTISAPLEQKTTIVTIATTSDQAYRWLIRRVLDIIPDIERFDLSLYVAEGFNIPTVQLLVSFLLLVGYLLPWIILGYYLLRWREIASAS